MDGWSKIAAGVALGIAGTVYATNRKVREKLPGVARDLPDSVKRRFEDAVSAAREASASRREEILKDLSRHQAAHPPSHPGKTEPDFAVGKDGNEGTVTRDETSGRVETYGEENPRGDIRQ